MGDGGDLAGWMARRLHADHALIALAALLLGGDAVILTHARATAEAWIGGQLLLLALAGLALAHRHPAPATGIAAGLMLALALMKLLKPHLPLGAALAAAVPLGGAGLGAPAAGKLVAEAGLGAACLGAALLARRLALDRVAERAALVTMALVLGLAVAGIVGHLAGALPRGRALLAVAEDIVEMLAASLAGLALVALCRTAPACPRSRLAAI
jgi:hypothetical protein